MTVSPPPDQKQRDRAIDTRASFIVQAPAGSGKTALLVQRYLALLAQVEAPENILAITFTRKATAEMRRRIIDELTGQAMPRDDAAGENAAAARARDAECDWRIADNPRRLRIQTIDAFCNELVWRMPWSSRFGAPPALAEDPAPLYFDAATRALDHIERSDGFADAAEAMLALVDANWGRARDLLAAMLARRDQWMRALGGAGDWGGDDRARIEAMWRAEIERVLQAARAAFEALKPAGREAWVELGGYAAGNLAADSAVCTLREMTEFPAAKHADLDAWRGLAALALTQGGALRKTVTKKDGFPVDDDGQREQKSRMLELLETARAAPGLAEVLATVRHLPGGQFDDAEWQSVDALVKLLRVAAAELRLVFKERNQADYIELTQRAALALGDADAPTDLALAFDYQLRHILMDEFQDTSSAHLELLEKLTAGWQAGDGRTLFLVGDPMQSIYRFREAEVGNFLAARESGVGDIRLNALRLTANFRSAHELVDWFNATFAAVLPAADDAAAGAVSYARADPCACIDGGVQVHAAVGESPGGDGAEAAAIADLVADIIAKTRCEDPAHKIAILGRTRRHLTAVAAALRDRGIAFCGRDLERLGERPSIRDLIALSRALHQPADRVAMLSLLRAPFCGVGLSALSALVESADAAATLPELWRDEARVAALTKDDRARLARLSAVIDAALARRGRVSLRANVEAAWLALGAPATMDAADLDDCARYLDLLADLESAGADITPAALRDAAEALWARPNAAASVELLTIHKAKGLEFDHVIVPRLDGRARGPESPLLRWRKLPDQLLIAPLPSSAARGAGGGDPFYRHLAHLEKQHEAFERGRLLYVACTRAKRRLHLFGRAARGKDDAPAPPPAGSLLALLWQQVAAEFERAAGAVSNAGDDADDAAADEISPPPSPSPLWRLPLGWRPPPLPEGIAAGAADTPAAGAPEQLEFSWAGETARITGIVIHHILQQVDAIGWEAWRRRAADGDGWRTQLLQNGLPEHNLQAALAHIADAVACARDDPRAAWIFSARHSDIRVEWPLTGLVDGRIKQVVIDRSFVDEHGARWVIDFKSSRHEGGDLDAFLDRERIRHRPQMDNYAEVVGALTGQDVHLGLYFPALRGWREW